MRVPPLKKHSTLSSTTGVKSLLKHIRAEMFVTSPLRFDSKVKYWASDAAGSVERCSTAWLTASPKSASRLWSRK
jgi:hypothetical protein